MEIFIPTYGRVGRQTTVDSLPPVWQDQCVLVCYREEAPHLVERGYQVLVYPKELPRGIGRKRQFIFDYVQKGKLCMFDDDLVFATRREDIPTRFRQMQDSDYHDMFATIDKALDSYIHGAIATREGGNRNAAPVLVNNRALRAHFFHLPVPSQYVERFMQDFTMTLDLLVQGHKNIILNQWVQNQHGSNTVGGCSEARTPEAHKAAAVALHERYPDFVSLVEKTTKGAWGGGTRTDVKVQWKKLYQWGLENNG